MYIALLYYRQDRGYIDFKSSFLMSGVWEFLFSADFLIFENFLVPKFQLFLWFSAHFWHFYTISRCFSSFFACGLWHPCHVLVLYCLNSFLDSIHAAANCLAWTANFVNAVSDQMQASVLLRFTTAQLIAWYKTRVIVWMCPENYSKLIKSIGILSSSCGKLWKSLKKVGKKLEKKPTTTTT